MAIRGSAASLLRSAGDFVTKNFLRNSPSASSSDDRVKSLVNYGEQANSLAAMANLERSIEGAIEKLSDRNSNDNEINGAIESLRWALEYSEQADDSISRQLRNQVRKALSTLGKPKSKRDWNATNTQMNKMGSVARSLSSALERYRAARNSMEEGVAHDEKKAETERLATTNIHGENGKQKRTLIQVTQEALYRPFMKPCQFRKSFPKLTLGALRSSNSSSQLTQAGFPDTATSHKGMMTEAFDRSEHLLLRRSEAKVRDREVQGASGDSRQERRGAIGRRCIDLRSELRRVLEAKQRRASRSKQIFA